MSNNSVQTPQKKMRGQNIQVYVRVRPLNQEERLARSCSVVTCRGKREVSVQERVNSKSFAFDQVFPENSKQADLYKTVVQPLIKQVMEGYNCTVFAYGQTGTGKTYTMEGINDYDGSWEQDPNAGIIPRSLVEIFDSRKKSGYDENSLQIKVSFLELYNEEIFDLLSKGMDLDRKHKIFEDSSKKGSVIVQGLEEVVVHSKESVLKILQEGSLKRQTAATKMNATSSRSHTIFTITVTKTEKSIVGQERFIEGKLNLVDLAGSENIGRSGAVDRRAREAGKINESLLTLGRVINSLVKRETHIPYRESKLTRLLQDSLGGRTKTSIVATISPASINLDETLSTLVYAYSAKDITNRPEVNQKISVASKMAEIQHKLEAAQRELLEQRDRDGGVFISLEKKDEYEKKIIELDQLRKEYRDLSTLFDLKTSENEKLNEDLNDTIRQLEEKSDVLFKTQAEKEVQEHLNERHVKDKAVMKDQELELLHIVAQQHDDLDIVQQSKERKSQVESHNIKEGERYLGEFTERQRQLPPVLETLSSAFAAVTDAADSAMTNALDMSHEAVGKTLAKSAVNLLSGAQHAYATLETTIAHAGESRQERVVQWLKEEQAAEQVAAAAAQKLHGQSAAANAEMTAFVKTMDSNVQALIAVQEKQNSKLQESHVTNMKQREDLEEASNRNTESLRERLRKEKDALTETLEKTNDFLLFEEAELSATQQSLDDLVDTVSAMQRQVASMKRQVASREVAVADMKKKILVDSEKLVEIGKILVQMEEVDHAKMKERKQLELQALEENKQGMDRAMGESYNLCQDTDRISEHLCSKIEEETKNVGEFVDLLQESRKERLEKADRSVRQESEMVAKELEEASRLSRAGQEQISEMLKTDDKTRTLLLESLDRTNSEFHSKMKYNSLKHSEGLTKLATITREGELATRHFFAESQQRDQPTGKTPAREVTVARTYPKELEQATPDSERVRRFRHCRDLGAAQRLQIDDEDDTEDEEDNNKSSDSLITASSAVTEETSNRGQMSANISVKSEEGGYVSDRENREPAEIFTKPASRLIPPKTYPVSTVPPVRTRNSSTNRRNVLGSATYN